MVSDIVTEDIFDLGNNRMTIEEHISIAEDVIKELGLRINVVFSDSKDLTGGGNEKETKLTFLSHKEAEDDSMGFLADPPIIVAFGDSAISFKIVLANADKREGLEKVFDKITETVDFSFCCRDGCLICPMTFPQVADDYFKCYFSGIMCHVILMLDVIKDEGLRRNLVGDDLYFGSIRRTTS